MVVALFLLLLTNACSVFAADAAKPEFVLKVGMVVSDVHPDMLVMKSTFVPFINEKAGGRIKVELYPNAQLGGDRELVESIQMGTIQIAMPATSFLAAFDKRIQVLDLPYLFTTREAAFEALDGELGEKLNSILLDKKLLVLGYVENGFRHVFNVKRPVLSPADLTGLKLRTMENPMHIAFFKKLGANPTPMNYGELYSALQQGTVDGAEAPVTLIRDAKFYEVQKYLSTTGHVFSVTALLGSKVFMDKLPEDLRQIVLDASRAYVMAQRKLMVEKEIENMNFVKENKMEITELTAEQKKAFVEATASVYPQFADTLTAELMEIVKKVQK